MPCRIVARGALTRFDLRMLKRSIDQLLELDSPSFTLTLVQDGTNPVLRIFDTKKNVVFEQSANGVSFKPPGTIDAEIVKRASLALKPFLEQCVQELGQRREMVGKARGS